MFLPKSTSDFLLPEIWNYCASSAYKKKENGGEKKKKDNLFYWSSGGLCEDIISMLPNLFFETLTFERSWNLNSI